MNPEEYLFSLDPRSNRERKIYFGESATCDPLFIHNSSKIKSPEVNPVIVSHLEKILQMTFLTSAEDQANVCMANAEEVRFSFRSTFTALNILDYVYGFLSMDEQIFDQSANIFIPYPNDCSEFEKRLTHAERKR